MLRTARLLISLILLAAYAVASLTFGAATSNRLALAAGLDNVHTFSAIIWHFPTTRTDGRRLWDKGNTDKACFWNFEATGIDCEVGYTTGSAGRVSSTSYTLSAWHYNAVTYDEPSQTWHLYHGTLTAEATEETYSGSPTTGSSGVLADSSNGFTIGNIGGASPASAYQGRIAFFAHYNYVLTLAQAVSYQFRPVADSGCDVFMWLGANGTGTHPNWSTLGIGISGTVTGATASDSSPFPMAIR